MGRDSPDNLGLRLTFCFPESEGEDCDSENRCFCLEPNTYRVGGVLSRMRVRHGRYDKGVARESLMGTDDVDVDVGR